jgi:hypothetical protein
MNILLILLNWLCNLNNKALRKNMMLVIRLNTRLDRANPQKANIAESTTHHIHTPAYSQPCTYSAQHLIHLPIWQAD